MHSSTASTVALTSGTGDRLESHLGDVAVPDLAGTALPVREQFRCRRWWFFYHDIRAFTTSWLPLPLFAVYRVLLATYILVWMILHIIARRDEFGARWLIFLTDLSYALLFFAMLSLAILSVVYTIVYYSCRKVLLKHIPKKDFPICRIYMKQDNIPWYVKVIWLLYNTACSSAVVVLVGYWSFVYNPCDDDDNAMVAGSESSGNGTDAGSTSAEFCQSPDVHTIQVHGINAVLVLLDLVVSRVPYQFLHLLYAPMYTIAYIIFSIIYTVAGGVNHVGQPYIYSNIDYSNLPFSALFAIVIALSPIVSFLLLFVLALLRDVITVRIGCCFRDVKQLPYRDHREDQNGFNGELMTKM